MSNELSNSLGRANVDENAPKQLPKVNGGLKQRDPPREKTPALEDHWTQYNKSPTPENTAMMLTRIEPTINSALTSYAGGNQSLKGHAKSLAVGALQTYDPNRGVKLETHLMSQLRPLSRLHAETSASVKVPERIRADLYRVNQNHQEFFDENGREPADSELADRTGISMKRIAHVRKFARSEVSESSLTSKGEDGDDETFYPGTETNDPQKIWMEYVHHDLAPIDQKILEWKTGFNGKEILSTGEIAARLNISSGAVSQRAAKIHAKIAEGKGVLDGD